MSSLWIFVVCNGNCSRSNLRVIVWCRRWSLKAGCFPLFCMACVISLPVSPTWVLVPKCADCGHCWVYSFYVLLLIFPNLTFAPKWCADCVHCVVSFVVLLPLFNYLFLCQKVLITAATLNRVRLQYFFSTMASSLLV